MGSLKSKKALCDALNYFWSSLNYFLLGKSLSITIPIKQPEEGSTSSWTRNRPKLDARPRKARGCFLSRAHKWKMVFRSTPCFWKWDRVYLILHSSNELLSPFPSPFFGPYHCMATKCLLPPQHPVSGIVSVCLINSLLLQISQDCQLGTH